MRLPETTLSAIHHAARLLPEGSHVYLFGSRVDDTRRGGDIDLWLELPSPLDALALAALCSRFVAAIWQQVGRQRIDVVFSAAGEADDRLIIEEARRNGVKLA
ncbi:nucleotidyltransferase domain-containing protein [Crenobacter intestini]|uniref:Nucleotidyltransferase domain-containing protein n=1 Tax=Crenobacter intestini TaxID=2563443 RepID=A0A4T0UKA4_9NEIS|nr:nucleotidyltransferase domain-containing protein [Crenobacter intestini]TIC78977.1 nucleotidyltransferase domain-containing protein [Crenobacter intestini]